MSWHYFYIETCCTSYTSDMTIHFPQNYFPFFFDKFKDLWDWKNLDLVQERSNLPSIYFFHVAIFRWGSSLYFKVKKKIRWCLPSFFLFILFPLFWLILTNPITIHVSSVVFLRHTIIILLFFRHKAKWSCLFETMGAWEKKRWLTIDARYEKVSYVS